MKLVPMPMSGKSRVRRSSVKRPNLLPMLYAVSVAPPNEVPVAGESQSAGGRGTARRGATAHREHLHVQRRRVPRIIHKLWVEVALVDECRTPTSRAGTRRRAPAPPPRKIERCCRVPLTPLLQAVVAEVAVHDMIAQGARGELGERKVDICCTRSAQLCLFTSFVIWLPTERDAQHPT